MALVYGLSHKGEMRYVGKTLRTSRHRLRKHFDAARAGRATYVCKWIRAVGYDVQIVVLERDPPGDLGTAERAWIAMLRGYGCRLTNLTDGGEGTPGFRHRPESLAKMREVQRALVTPERRAKLSLAQRSIAPDVRARMSAALRGRTYSDEGKARLSQAFSGAGNAFYGKSHSAESIAKMSAAKTGRPGRKLSAAEVENLRLVNTGRTHSAETKAKISAAKTGKPGHRLNVGRTHSPEARAKMSAARKGRPAHNKGMKASPEAREKMRLAQLGRKHSPETLARMSKAQKLRWARQKAAK